MYLSGINRWSLFKNLYIYKLYALSSVFTSLMIVQLLAIVFSLGGSSRVSMGHGSFVVSIENYSNTLIFLFTIVWALFIGISVNFKPHRNAEFSFVTNRLMMNVSNIAFLLTANVVGGVTTGLTGYGMRMFIYWISVDKELILGHTAPTVYELFLSIFVAILYLCLFSAIGYFAGTLVQLHPIWGLILPGMLIGLLFIDVGQGRGFFVTMFQFYSQESSLAVLFLKILAPILVLYPISTVFSDRMEVRR